MVLLMVSNVFIVNFEHISHLLEFPWLRSGVFIVSFEHTLHLVLVFLLLTMDM